MGYASSFHTLQLVVGILVGKLATFHPGRIALPSQYQLTLGLGNLFFKRDHGALLVYDEGIQRLP